MHLNGGKIGVSFNGRKLARLPDLFHFELQVHKEPHTSYIVTQFLFLFLFVHSFLCLPPY